jgi:hypothetical protein
MAVGSGLLLNLLLGVLMVMAPGVAFWILVLATWGAIRHLRQLRFHSASQPGETLAQI